MTTQTRVMLALVVAAHVSPAQATETKAALELRVETNRASYPLHSPLTVYATFSNSDEGSARVTLRPSPVCGSLRFKVKAPREEFYLDYVREDRPLVRDGATLTPEVECSRRELGPGDRWTAAVNTAYDPERRRFVLADVGEYSIVATYGWSGVQLESSPVVLVVTEPSASERAAYGAFVENIAVMTLRPAWRELEVTPALMDQATKYAEEFAGSVYSEGLLAGVKRSLGSMAGRAPAESRARVARLLRQPAAGMTRGPERDAQEEVSPALRLVLLFGNRDVGEEAGAALSLPVDALREAASFARRHGGTEVGDSMSSHLGGILRTKERSGVITSQERALLDELGL